jgi:hypothetical protein
LTYATPDEFSRCVTKGTCCVSQIPPPCFISQLVTVVHTSRYTTLTLFWQNSKALSTDPAPLTSKDRYRLSWEAATDRFLDAAELGAEQHTGPGRYGRTGLSQIRRHCFCRPSLSTVHTSQVHCFISQLVTVQTDNPSLLTRPSSITSPNTVHPYSKTDPFLFYKQQASRPHRGSRGARAALLDGENGAAAASRGGRGRDAARPGRGGREVGSTVGETGVMGGELLAYWEWESRPKKRN